ncbi:MAG: hypothetical protein ACI90V_005451 [Bacillariaceae sp.]|jgi:hypothetical protein
MLIMISLFPFLFLPNISTGGIRMTPPSRNNNDVSPLDPSNDPSAPTDATEICPEDAVGNPHPVASTWFNLVKRGGGSTAACWSYFHVIEEVIDDSKLESKLRGIPHLACCNLCGKVSSYSSLISKSKKYKQTNSKLDSHLTSHDIYFGKLFGRVSL